MTYPHTQTIRNATPTSNPAPPSSRPSRGGARRREEGILPEPVQLAMSIAAGPIGSRARAPQDRHILDNHLDRPARGVVEARVATPTPRSATEFN